MYYLISITLALTSQIQTNFLFNWGADSFGHNEITKEWIDSVIKDACSNEIENNDFIPYAMQFTIKEDGIDNMDNTLAWVDSINSLEEEILSFIVSENDENTKINYFCNFEKVKKDQFIGNRRRLRMRENPLTNDDIIKEELNSDENPEEMITNEERHNYWDPNVMYAMQEDHKTNIEMSKPHQVHLKGGTSLGIHKDYNKLDPGIRVTMPDIRRAMQSESTAPDDILTGISPKFFKNILKLKLKLFSILIFLIFLFICISLNSIFYSFLKQLKFKKINEEEEENETYLSETNELLTNESFKITELITNEISTTDEILSTTNSIRRFNCKDILIDIKELTSPTFPNLEENSCNETIDSENEKFTIVSTSNSSSSNV